MSGPGIGVRWRRLDDLDPAEVEAWAGLGEEAPGAHPFTMPQFVLPAARWLTPEQPPGVLSVERRTGAGVELLGIGCFDERSPGLFVPLRHLRGYRTPHSFRGDMLHRAGAADEVAAALLEFARARGLRALAFHTVPADCPVMAALRRAGGAETGWYPRGSFERAELRLDAGQAPRLRASVVKDLRRRQRRLAERGEVAFRILQGDAADADAAERHLRLEHAGWKGDAGSSMLATQAQSGFFRELAARFRETGNMVFSEILCDGEVIASTSNILVGDTLHAFKCGWDPGFAQYSPGRLNELWLLEAIRETWPALACFDGNASDDSYMARLLPDRGRYQTGAFAATRTGRGLQRAARWLRPLAYRFGDDG